jgi:hypothetical protein
MYSPNFYSFSYFDAPPPKSPLQSSEILIQKNKSMEEKSRQILSAF